MTDWRNRIVGQGEEDPEQLLINPGNWRIHPRVQQDALTGVLNDVGWVQNILVNRQTGHVVDGHLRVSLALRNHVPSVPVVYVDLTPEEESLVLATLDPIAAMAGTDKAKLEELIRNTNSDSEQTQVLLTRIVADAGIIPPEFQPVDVSEQPRLDQKKPIQCPNCGAEFSPE